MNIKKKSHIREHVVGTNPAKTPKMLSIFKMKVLKQARSALSHKVKEAVEIHRGKHLLNSKDEYNRTLNHPILKVKKEREDMKAKEKNLRTPEEEEQAVTSKM